MPRWQETHLSQHLWHYIAEVFLECEIFQTEVVEKIKTLIFCSATISRKSCRLWDNVEEYGTAKEATEGNIIRRMRFACWTTKATDTQAEYVILALSRQQRLFERPSMLRSRNASLGLVLGSGHHCTCLGEGTDRRLDGDELCQSPWTCS